MKPSSGILISLAALFVVAAEAVTSPRLSVGLNLYGNTAESTASHARIVGTEVEARFEDQLSPHFHLKVAGGMQIEAGATQARWAEEFRPRNVQRLRQATLTWQPDALFKIVVGAADQDKLASPLLLQRQAFPAIQEAFDIPLGPWRLEIFGQQAVANDTSSLQPWASGAQGLPAFYLERIGITWKPSETFSWNAYGSHFAFQHLGGPNVFASQFMGNSIEGTDATNAVYRYHFQGLEAGTVITARWGRFSPELRASVLRNTAAPRGRSEGWRLAASVDYQANEHFRLLPSLELFRMESDAAPAFYNERVFGHNNRNGFGLRVSALWPKDGLELQGRWVHSGVIDAHPFQSDLDWVQVQFSAQYDVL